MSIISELNSRTEWGAPVPCPTLENTTNSGYLIYTYPALMGMKFVDNREPDDEKGFNLLHLYYILQRLNLIEGSTSRSIIESKMVLEIGQLEFVCVRYPGIFERLERMGDYDEVELYIELIRDEVPIFEALAWVLLLFDADRVDDHSVEYVIQLARTGVKFDDIALGGIPMFDMLDAHGIDSEMFGELVKGSRKP